MNHCYLEQAGLYRATLEAMLYGPAPSQDVQEQFNDSVFGRKAKNVNDLVKRFEKNLAMKESFVESLEKKESKVSEKSEVESVVQPAKPRSTIPSMEQFISGILRASSPIPQAPAEDPTEPLVELKETPILPYHPVKRHLDFAILDTDTTKSVRPTMKSEGRAKIAGAKASTTPKSKATIVKESPDSAYHSAGSSAASTPSGLSQPQAQAREIELDIYMKLARAELHEQIKKYSTWKAEKLRSISTKVCSMRISALQKPSLTCQTTLMMTQIYQNCLTGPATKELDTIVVSIFHLLDEQIHVERISVLEEYVVMKYCKKMMQ